MTRETAAALAAALVGEMIYRWRRGECLLAEEFLGWHPELWEHPEAAADLIYEELCQRQEYGREISTEELLRRFPQWRSQLEVLLDCQRLLGPRSTAPQFPSAGESLGDFLLLAELGSGGHGLVFVAAQRSLGDRPVVLKLTPCEAHEHLSLARLQHTHIVPLYFAQDYPDRGLRVLCMPYFGGATLAQLLDEVRSQPLGRRTGKDLLDALDRVQASAPVIAPERSPSRPALAGFSYPRAVCWIGACLAEALQYAHEHGLVHLDLKPSNVLLAADGQPMLLDFHLAWEPIEPGGVMPWSFGGTAHYMSPEQQAAVLAVQQGKPIERGIDGRSDVYSLGVVLYEALSGKLPAARGKPRSLDRCNSQVSAGLADVIGKCLALDPNDRYPSMAALAVDLRRHLVDLPLVGVRNRSLRERWRKWRRRRPHGFALAGMMLAILLACGAVAVAAVSHFAQRSEQVRTTLKEGQAQIDHGHWDEAIATLECARSMAVEIPYQGSLVHRIDRRLEVARQGRRAAERATLVLELHQLADHVRFLYGAAKVPLGELRRLETRCRILWENRARIVQRLGSTACAALEPAVRDDLLDLAIFWADLQARLASPADLEKARSKARIVLEEAESLFGANPVLDEEHRYQGGTRRSGQRPRSCCHQRVDTPWEHYALGRALLRVGELDRAAEELRRAVRLQPQGLWPNFYEGLCAFRRERYVDAVAAFSLCIGAQPAPAVCYFNRALAFEALGHTNQALSDYDQALRIDPTLAVAAVNRGMLHYRAKSYRSARADLEWAQELGADPATVAFDLALVNLACGENAVALDNLRRALGHDPQLRDARVLHDRLLNR
jgi:serine/threonine protein kinase/tetratricopeptide (TPR) repeat protein